MFYRNENSFVKMIFISTSWRHFDPTLNCTPFDPVQVNANSSILPGVKLGTLAIDTCTIDTHTVKMVSALLL